MDDDVINSLADKWLSETQKARGPEAQQWLGSKIGTHFWMSLFEELREIKSIIFFTVFFDLFVFFRNLDLNNIIHAMMVLLGDF